MAEPVVLLDTPAPFVAPPRINRQALRNAIDRKVRQGFIEAIERLHADADLRALVLGGVGHVFSAGGDVPSMVGTSDEQARDRMRHVHALCRLLAGSRLPVVSTVEGSAAGAAVGLALLGGCIVVGPGAHEAAPVAAVGLARPGAWPRGIRPGGLPAERRLQGRLRRLRRQARARRHAWGGA